MQPSYGILLLLLLAAGVWSAAVAIGLMAMALLRPPRMTDGRAAWRLRRLSPGDLGLHFENAPFTVRDEAGGRGGKMVITGWWIPARAQVSRCVILLHDYGDAKVGGIAWAPLWHGLDFHVLALDLRAHGESDGTLSTGGFREREDLAQVINELRAERPEATRQLVLFGVGLGGAVAVATAASRDDLAAVVLDSPFADFRQFAMATLDGLGFPGGLLARLSIDLAQALAHVKFDAVRTRDLIAEIRCPVMAIYSQGDRVMTAADAETLQARLAGRACAARGIEKDEWWSVPEVGRSLALAADPQAYRRRLGNFLDGALDAASDGITCSASSVR